MKTSAGALPPPRWRTYLRLGRVSNLPTVWTNVVAGAALGGGSLEPAGLIALQAALSLFYAGGMFLNDAFDRATDARERPERPLPAGHLRPAEVFIAGFGLLAAGILAVAVAAPGPAPIASASVLAAVIVAYDLWHKSNPASPVVMAACRMLVYVTAALATSGDVASSVLSGAALLGLYLVGLTYVAKQEARGHVRQLWPYACLGSPLVWAIPMALRSGIGAFAWIALLAWIAATVRLLRGGRSDRVPRAVGLLIAGISLVDALLVAATGSAGWALVTALGGPLTLLLQRYVRGT